MEHSNHSPTHNRMPKVGHGGSITQKSAIIPATRTCMQLRPRRQKVPEYINKSGKNSSTVVEGITPTGCPPKTSVIQVTGKRRLNTAVGRKLKLQVPSVPLRDPHQEVIERLCIHLAVRTMHRELRLFLWLGGVPNLSSFLAYTRFKTQFTPKEFDVVRVQVLNKQDPMQWLEVGDHGVDRLKPTQSEHKSFREVLLENLIRRPGKVYDGYVSIMVNAN